MNISLEVISRIFDTASHPIEFLWNVTCWIFFKTLIHFWSHSYQEKCAKWLLRVLWVTTQNGAQGTIYQPRDKLD